MIILYVVLLRQNKKKINKTNERLFLFVESVKEIKYFLILPKKKRGKFLKQKSTNIKVKPRIQQLYNFPSVSFVPLFCTKKKNYDLFFSRSFLLRHTFILVSIFRSFHFLPFHFHPYLQILQQYIFIFPS